MRRRAGSIILTIVAMVLILAFNSFAISEGDLKRLMAAGIDGNALAAILEEKTVETVAFTVDELIALKQKGHLSNETIRMIVKNRSFLKNREPVVYGKEVQPIRLSSVEDIIALKKAGLSDEVIQTVIRATSESTETSDREKAWKMLNEMGIVIDGRQRPSSGQ
ncbi:hypothetical protein [Desulfatirhabdium butyrativorans]|uniref:hypothetical protein n=1 Tax=Desulfatirhabdium butyrativorans TaxID=340467 RepID=UPI000489B15F|nr:hypothetical protein [Desulfatirhabdium butyrativorans]